MSNDTLMKVSVIVPTYNGAHKLLGILNALKEQSFQDFELIVVVDGSTDNSLELLEKFQTIFSNLKIVYQENKGRAAVRNKGAEESTGELLIFFDDDMLPHSHCIKYHLQHHQSYMDSILTGGLEDKFTENSNDFLQFKSYLSQLWNKPLVENQSAALPNDNLFITAANFSMSRKLFFQLGGFDALLSDAEDYDLAIRANQQGISLYYEYRAFAWHVDIVSCKTYIIRMRQYALAHKKLIEIKPFVHGNNTKYSVSAPKGLKKLFYHLFGFHCWIRTIDHNFWIWLPKYFRYKLYDWVITANGSFFPELLKFKK